MSETIGQNKIEFKERKRWVFLGLPFTFTVYRIDEEIINVRKGFLNTKEDDCYMYKVTDVELETSLGERIFGLGTVVCFTGDTTDQQLRITHVKNSRAIKDFILKESENQRIKRRTLNTQNISAGHIHELHDDIDGIHDAHMF